MNFPPALAADRERYLLRIRPLLDSGALGPESIDLLDRFVSLVERQAASQSLVAAGDRDVLFTRHVLDSLNPLSLFDSANSGSADPRPGTALDIGSGAGFPGIPLAIAWPTTQVTLLESRERKAAFLERAAREIPLRNVSVVCDRLELWADTYRGAPFDAALVRAVGDLPALLESLRKVCRPGARWVYFLGEEREPEAVLAGLGARVKRGALGGRLLTGVI